MRRQRSEGVVCQYCPVVNVTNITGCHRTPYYAASGVWGAIDACSYTPDAQAQHTCVIEFQECAQDMIDWIDENLMPLVDTPSLRTQALLTRQRPLADEQQLPSEITRAAEKKEGGDQ